MIHAERQTLDLEEEDRVETIVAGLRYTGPEPTASPQRPRDQGGWPGRSAFQGGSPTEVNDEGRVVEREPGPIQIGVIPDTVDEETVEGGTLPGLENLPDFEVIYDRSTLAEAILGANYLPPTVFGGPETAPDYTVRSYVFEALDIPDRLGTAPGAEDALREALAETAEMDLEEEEPPDQSRAEEYKADHTRSDLYNAATALGHNVDWSDARKSDLAEWLAQQPAGDVRDALNGEYEPDGGDADSGE
jgi:hypothetical protein